MDDAADIDRLVKEAEAAMGKIDILVNNAGITRDNISMRMKDEEWEKVLQVNLTGTFPAHPGRHARHDAAGATAG